MIALLGSVSCGSGTTSPGTSTSVRSPSQTPLHSRPVELPVDRVDPCALLTPTQQAQLGVGVVGREEESDELGSLACQWDNNGGKPDNGWVARLVTKRGAEYALGSATGVQVVQVDGFAAVQTAPPYVDPNRNCVLVVDVAHGQSLDVKYSNFAGDYPGINHEVACQQDRRAAEFMVANLHALAR